MIAAELAQRRFVQLKKNLAQCLGFRMPSGETLSVNLTQRVDGRVSVFVADITVVVAVAIVETCAAHGALHCAYSERASSCLVQMAILRRNRGIKAGPIAQPCKRCPVSVARQALSLLSHRLKSVQYARWKTCAIIRRTASMWENHRQESNHPASRTLYRSDETPRCPLHSATPNRRPPMAGSLPHLAACVSDVHDGRCSVRPFSTVLSVRVNSQPVPAWADA
jgi:hypothetical protein